MTAIFFLYRENQKFVQTPPLETQSLADVKGREVVTPSTKNWTP